MALTDKRTLALNGRYWLVHSGQTCAPALISQALNDPKRADANSRDVRTAAVHKLLDPLAASQLRSCRRENIGREILTNDPNNVAPEAVPRHHLPCR
jgi:hypothetical protein